eukprot:CAMPEP_0202894384 /NCGR_PEP_ID=MMETSP1392-20130828/3806_1 /ASSEMBLY_ACC=CAM_ASM_000868 /TAXON_ID=225041 /ORGANISM="Chlamydomonas chlamydogama, Strain SAG 11-48b" /LENGTH=55 /DNA_ID=CAMNT_0049579071 /DNA_START=256 /DNA_END=420 /DNA_ORIENTATION=+
MKQQPVPREQTRVAVATTDVNAVATTDVACCCCNPQTSFTSMPWLLPAAPALTPA